MNVVSTLAKILRGGQVMHENAEERFITRLKEADDTNTSLERSIIEWADGSSVAEITCRMATGDPVWATWIQKWMREALQSLEQRGFIQIENGQKPRALIRKTHSGN